MFQTKRILVSCLALVGIAAGLAACGQTGALYLPTEPAAARRATLPESLLPGSTQDPAPSPAHTPVPGPASK